jgi:sugar phosphate isomerase/epimerase
MALILSAGTTQATPFLDRLAAVKAAGFDGVSMFAADFDVMAAAGIGAAEIRSRVADAGLAISEIEIVGNWLPGVGRKRGMPGWLRDLVGRMTPERVIAIAAAVGARGISVGDMLDVDCGLDVATERFAGICALAAEAGLYVALEFIPTGRIASLADGWAVVRDAGAANGGLLVDSWHFFRSGSSLDLLGSLPAAAITSVQIGDAPAVPEADLDHAMAHDRLLPGTGALDLAGFMAAIRRTGTTAPIGIEVFSDALARAPIGVIAERCAEAVRPFVEGNGR